MASSKRTRDEAPASQKAKKQKKSHTGLSDTRPPLQSSLINEDIDFPRGGGTSLTPLEIKTAKAEAQKEADEELFKVSNLHPRYVLQYLQ